MDQRGYLECLWQILQKEYGQIFNAGSKDLLQTKPYKGRQSHIGTEAYSVSLIMVSELMASKADRANSLLTHPSIGLWPKKEDTCCQMT